MRAARCSRGSMQSCWRMERASWKSVGEQASEFSRASRKIWASIPAIYRQPFLVDYLRIRSFFKCQIPLTWFEAYDRPPTFGYPESVTFQKRLGKRGLNTY